MSAALKQALWAGAMVLAIVSSHMVLGLALSAGAQHWLGVGQIAATSVSAAVILAIAVIVMKLRPQWFTGAGRAPAHSRLLKPVALPLLGALALVFLAAQGLAAWVQLNGGGEGYRATSDAFGQASAGTVLLLTLLMAPLLEEVLYRGMLYRLLRRRLGVWASALVAALAFGLMHGNLVQTAVAVPLGVLSALLYERTGRLMCSVLLHMAFNAAAAITPVALIAALAQSTLAVVLVAIGAGIALRMFKDKALAAVRPAR